MKAVRFTQFGGPEVMHLVEVPEPHASSGQVRVTVHACGVNPADWKIARGDLGGSLPQGVGLEVAGVVDEVGEGVTDVAVGDRVFGSTTNGAAEFALLSDYARLPSELTFVHGAALPVALETATRGLDLLRVGRSDTLLVNGAAGAVGTVATQLAVLRGARVIATASEENFTRLRGYGAEPTVYGDGLAQRVDRLAPTGVDAVFDLGPGGALPTLILIAGDAGRILTASDFQGAQAHNVATTGHDGTVFRWDALPNGAALAARGELRLPIQQSFPLGEFASAHELSRTGHLSGKLVLTVP